MDVETYQGQITSVEASTDDTDSHTLIRRRSFLVSTGAGMVGTSMWASSVAAEQPGLDVEFDGSIESGTEVVIRVRDHRGRQQEFVVDGSAQLPASTTLDRIRTNREIEFDLLIYGHGAVEIDKLDFAPSTGVYPEEAGDAGTMYAMARNIHSVVYSGLTYLGIIATLVGVVHYGVERVSPSLTTSMSGAKLALAGIGLLFVLFALGALAGVLGWIVSV